MSFISYFRPTPVVSLPPSYTNSEITSLAKEFVKRLDMIKNTSANKGSNKISKMHDETDKYAKKTAKNAQKEKDNLILKNANKLKKSSYKSLSYNGSPFTRKDIEIAEKARLNIIAETATRLRALAITQSR